MKPWSRRIVLAALWVGVGAGTAGGVAVGMGYPSRAMVPFAVGVVAAVLILVIYGSARPASASPAGLGAGGMGAVRTASAPAPTRTALGLVIVVVGVVTGLTGSMVLILGGPQRAQISVSELPRRLLGQVHGLWDSALLEPDLDTLSEQLAGRDLGYLRLYEDYVSIDAHSTTYAGGWDHYVFREGSLELSWTDTMSGRGTFSVEDVDAAVIHAAVAQVYADDATAPIRSVSLTVDRGGLVIAVRVEGVYEDTERQFDARTGEEVAGG